MVSSIRLAAAAASTRLLLQQAVQLGSTVVDPQPVRGIHDPDQGIRLLKVVPPVRSKRLLATDIPWTSQSASTVKDKPDSTHICSVCTCLHVSRWQEDGACFPSHPSYSMVLMIKPRVGLTVLTSSPIILFTMVVLPALSRPLGIQCQDTEPQRGYSGSQHQDPELLVLQPSFSKN